MKKRLLIAMVAVMLPASAVLAADSLLEQGVKLLQSGDAKAAYELLEPQESARAGDKDFDLLFALAALDIGQNTRAVFALERVLALDPQNVRARAEIGRAYLALGETDSARTELESVKKQGVPEEVSRAIDVYLSAVERLENDSKTTIRGYIDATVGYDTNVNASPGRSEVAIPAFGGLPITLSSSSRAVGDFFASLGGGATIRSALTKELAFVAGASGSQRWNEYQGVFDTLSADANAGAVLTKEKDIYSFTLQAGSLALGDSQQYRNTAGYTAQWQRNVDARNQVSAFLQYSDQHYATQPIRDTERWVWGGSYAHATRDGHVGFVSAYLVEEDIRNRGNSPYLAFDGSGLRLGGQLRWNVDTVVFANASYENRSYRAVDPTFLLARNDQQTNLGFGATYSVNKDVKVTGQYGWTDNRSNIELNKYRRDMVSFTIRRDF